MQLPSGYNTTNYSVRASAKGWGSGWPACGGMSGQLVQVVGPKSAALVQGGVHRRIQLLCQVLIKACEERGYLLVKGWCWGAGCRAIAGTSTPSNHSWGLAMDINAPTNPYTSTGQHDIPDWMFALFRRYGFGVGADYSGRKDWMHFEFMGTPGDADIMTQLAAKEFGGGGTVTPPITPPTEEDDLPYSKQELKEASYGGVKWALEDVASVDPLIIKKVVGDYLAPVIARLDQTIAKLDGMAEAVWAKQIRSEISQQDEAAWRMLQATNTKVYSDSGAPPVTPPPTTGVYTVVAGDTFDGIAKAHGTDRAGLQALNPQVTDINNISIGQQLTVPK